MTNAKKHRKTAVNVHFDGTATRPDEWIEIANKSAPENVTILPYFNVEPVVSALQVNNYFLGQHSWT